MEKMIDLLQKDDASLKGQVLELKRELLNLRFRHRAKELKDLSQIRRVRRDVARVKTALTMRRMKKKES
ncbi:MAG: 50S ribosomal protein L29 [Holosporales bacterium]|jgi:large subunit ribosomal protein L29